MSQGSFAGTKAPITLEVVGTPASGEQDPMLIEPGEPFDGADCWSYLWAKYVWGFAPSTHCAASLVGVHSRRVKTWMPLNRVVTLDECKRPFDFLYVCGIPKIGGWKANFHLPLVWAPGEHCEATASTGLIFRVTNATRLKIPALPKGFDGRKSAFTSCRNWRFGVAYYGLVPRLAASLPLFPPSDPEATPD
jgi:hypothetical protein